MRIGIITFWQARDNYGQILQCLALQRKLIMMGHDPFLVRYKHSEHKNPWQDIILHFFISLIRLRWHNLFLRQNHLPSISSDGAKRQFDPFKSKYIEQSDLIYESLSDLRKNPPLADCYIVGSDQVWSKSLLWLENYVFFLDFGDASILRISYAASFSMNQYPKILKKRLKKLLSNFDAVSVREEKGVDICNSIGINAKLVVDPTMLFTNNFYCNFFHLKNNRSHHLFIYSLNITSADEIRWKDIREFSEKRKYDIIVTPSSGYIPTSELFGGDVKYYYSTIPEWLENIANSELVITTSFHGIVFCLLFHTRFIYVPLSGQFSTGNNRVLGLLNQIGIKGRVLLDNKSFESIDSDVINWDIVDRNLELLRNDSYSFLKDSLAISKV